MRVFVYARVSTKAQAEYDLSIPISSVKCANGPSAMDIPS